MNHSRWVPIPDMLTGHSCKFNENQSLLDFWFVSLPHQTMTSLKMAVFITAHPAARGSLFGLCRTLTMNRMKQHNSLLLGAGHMTHDLVSLI